MAARLVNCIICDKKIKGFGHNAEPVAKGRCCEDCNYEVVIPYRLKHVRMGQLPGTYQD